MLGGNAVDIREVIGILGFALDDKVSKFQGFKEAKTHNTKGTKAARTLGAGVPTGGTKRVR